MSQTLSALHCSLLWFGARCACVEGLAAPASIALQRDAPNTISRRPGPVGACSDAELAGHIRQQIVASRLLARATASYGHGCDLLAFARAPAVCDG